MGLAQRLDGEIISADALQVYRGFDIGTAKPSAQDRGRVPHHLVDILDPSEPYSAGMFAQRARALVDSIGDRRRLSLVVGGSGLYLRALLQGISPMPPVDRRLRQRLSELASSDAVTLRRMLELLDPEMARRVPPSDPNERPGGSKSCFPVVVRRPGGFGRNRSIPVASTR